MKKFKKGALNYQLQCNKKVKAKSGKPGLTAYSAGTIGHMGKKRKKIWLSSLMMLKLCDKKVK